MKRILLTTITALMSFAAIASDITTITMSPRASAATTFTRAFNDAVNGNFYQSANCEDSFQKFRNTPNSVLVFNSSMEFAARNKGLACLLETLKDTTVLYTGKVYFQMCKLPGTNFDLTPGKPEFSMGMASMYSTNRHQKTFRDKGVNIKMIPYSGAKTAIKGLYAGDVDVAWLPNGLVAKHKKRLECFAGTDPADKSDYFLGNQVPGKVVPDFHIHFVVLTNSNDPAVLAKLKNVKTNNGMQTFIKKSYNQGTWTPTTADVTAATDYINRMFNTWADK